MLHYLLQTEVPRTEPDSDKTTQTLQVADLNSGKRLKVTIWNVPLPEAKNGVVIHLIDVTTNPMKGSMEGSINVNSAHQVKVCISYLKMYKVSITIAKMKYLVFFKNCN